MARVAVTPSVIRRVSPTDGVSMAFTAADGTNKNEFTPSGNDILIAHNTDVGAQTVTINSTANKNSRTGDITADSLSAGEMHAYGFFQSDGWRQTGGTVHFEASDAAVKFCVLRLTA